MGKVFQVRMATRERLYKLRIPFLGDDIDIVTAAKIMVAAAYGDYGPYQFTECSEVGWSSIGAPSLGDPFLRLDTRSESANLSSQKSC